VAAFTYSEPAGLLVVHLLFVFLDLHYVLAAASAIVSDVELLIVASTGARRIDAEEQRWLDLEQFVRELDGHLVVDRARRQVLCPSCVKGTGSFSGFCLELPARLDECLDLKRRCEGHVDSTQHRKHVKSGLKQTQLPFAAAPSGDIGAAASR
jgi:hypothetical protein